MTKSVLNNSTLANIHATILDSETIGIAAEHLRVKPHALKQYLQKFGYREASFTFDYFKNLSVEDAQTRFGVIYHQRIVTIKVYISTYTLEEIHTTILDNPSLNAADLALGLYQYAFVEYLRKTLPANELITSDFLHNISKENAKMLFGDAYTRVISVPIKRLSQHTFADIHAQIQLSEDIMEAAARIGVYYRTLKFHLGKFLVNEQKITFEVFTNLTTEEAQAAFGDKYYQPMITSRRYNSNLSLADIHKALLECRTISEVKKKLDLCLDSLRYQLAKFTYMDKYLTIPILQGLSPQYVESLYGDAYRHPIPIGNAHFSLYTLDIIHNAIINSENHADAARVLIISPKTLIRNLNQSRYNNQTLSYDQLKTMQVETAKLYFGKDYYQPLHIEKKTFYDHSIADIHAQILANDNITQAAEKLSIRSDTFTIELKRFLYKELPLTFSLFKSLSIIDAQSFWNDAYEKPFVRTYKRKRSISMDVVLQSSPPLPVHSTEHEEAPSPVVNNEPNAQMLTLTSLARADSALTSSLSPSLFAPRDMSQFAPSESLVLPDFGWS